MSKLVLILNCGSSSLKFAVMDAETGEDMLSGLAECFNLDDARIKWKLHGVKGDAMLGAGAAHQEALDHIVGHILPQDPALADQLVAIGHRIVHGGEQFSRSVRIDDGVIAGIEAAIPFAPLHNPAHLIGIRAALKCFPLKNEIILVGQSQGAHAAFASAGYQPEYAPGLNIRATVLTGTPYFERGITATDILSPTYGGKFQIAGDPKIPYIFYIYLSAADKNSQLNPANYFQDKALPLLKDASKLCIMQLNDEVMKSGLNPGNSLKPGIESLLKASVGTIIYPTLKIDHPVFIGIGSVDINVPTAMQKRFSDAVKSAGTQVRVHLYEGLDHSGTVNPSLRDSVPFLNNILNDN